MNDITLKYYFLDNTEKQEINDFIEFLLSKKSRKKPNQLSEFKKRLLSVSTWSDSDIDAINKGSEMFNEWKVEEW
jgi:hypothetical protein